MEFKTKKVKEIARDVNTKNRYMGCIANLKCIVFLSIMYWCILYDTTNNTKNASKYVVMDLIIVF